MDWFFDGIGTEIIGIIISLIIGALGGGAVGYKIGIKRTVKQKQNAGDDTEQKQEFHIEGNRVGKKSLKNTTNIKQFQKAGKNAVQTQIGGISDDCR